MEKETNSTKKTTTTSKNTVKVTAKPKATTSTTGTKPKTTVSATAKKTEEKPKATTTKTTTKATATSTAAKKTTATTKVAADTTPKRTSAKSTAKTVPVEETTEVIPANNGGFSGFIASIKSNKFRLYGIIGLAAVLLLSLLIGIILGIHSCNMLKSTPYANAYANTTLVGYSSEILGTTQRYKPVEGVKDGGLETGYPKYGYTLSLTTEQKNAILAENISFCAKPTTNTGGVYDWMDENGYLYTGTRSASVPLMEGNAQRQLYKHSGSVGLYYGDVSDNEKAVVKRCTFRPRSYTSYYDVTGLYAPAGEVIKIQLTAADMNATGGIVVHIGQALYNGQNNNIWNARNFNRMPIILNTMYVTKDTAVYDESTGLWTAYVGSFVGGPIYIRDERVTFSVIISGGVTYPHFILGVTTEAEYNEYAKSSAPIFDLEIWDSGVLHSGPFLYAKNYSYNDLYKAAILWEKISLVSTRVVNQGIVFMYDPFVAAGAAVAFPGRRSVNCPASWMASSLNYDSFVTSGNWGNLHEYHHNFQNYGVGDRGEVTNNALNLVAYSLFTKISSARQISSYGGAGLSGWNCYTSATWALQRVNFGGSYISSTNGLATYATLLHNFGQDAFIKSTGSSGANYFNKWATVTHQDFSYYADLMYSYGQISSSSLTPTDYPMFVPVSSVYQTGRSYMYDEEKRYIETMQPYVIPYGKSFTVDLNPYTVNAASQYESGSVVIAKDFKYTIKSVKANGINGSFVPTETAGVYTFTPNKELLSGKIYVTLEIRYNDGTEEGSSTYNGHALNDVDLVIEFQQSHETNKAILERTTYYYTEDTKYSDAIEAFESNYAGYQSFVEMDNINPTQNSNTDIWYYPNTDAMHQNYPDAPANYFVDVNSIDEIKGKLYIVETGKYRIYLRGRQNCALYISLDGGKTYELAAHIDKTINTNNTPNFIANENTYIDLELEAESWVYFKEVLINVQINNSQAGFVGLGISQWTVPLYTTTVKYYDANGNEVSADSENIASSVTHYYNSRGQEVSAEEASNTDPIPPTSATYATAYRESYEFQKEFTSDYFYYRNYNYNYVGEPDVLTSIHTQTYMSEISNYVPWDENYDLLDIQNLFDGDDTTNIHSHNKFYVSESTPAIIAFDMGQTVKANSLTLYMYSAGFGDRAFPKVLSLEGSLNGKDWFEMGKWSSLSSSYSGKDLEFPEATFRYYKITVTASNYSAAPRFALSGLEIKYTQRLTGNGNNFFSPDNEMFKWTGKWQTENTNASFGHVYVGKKGAQVSFEFEGQYLEILSSSHYGKNFEVYIDGKLVKSATFKADDSDYTVSYLSPELSQGKHKVVIKCTGEANFDSFVFY